MGSIDANLVVLWLHLSATAFMVGLIWFVQIVHYPLFSEIGRGEFGAYALAHQSRTTLVVMPPMLVELATALMLAMGSGGSGPVAGWGLGLVGAIWVSTFAVQVPLHARLGRGYDARTQRLLVSTNWVRTILWTARLPIAGVLLARGLA